MAQNGIYTKYNARRKYTHISIWSRRLYACILFILARRIIYHNARENTTQQRCTMCGWSNVRNACADIFV